MKLYFRNTYSCSSSSAVHQSSIDNVTRVIFPRRWQNNAEWGNPEFSLLLTFVARLVHLLLCCGIPGQQSAVCPPASVQCGSVAPGAGADILDNAHISYKYLPRVETGHRVWKYPPNYLLPHSTKHSTLRIQPPLILIHNSEPGHFLHQI